MTPERWKQIDELAQSALERVGDEREGFLDKACAGDDELRRKPASVRDRTNDFTVAVYFGPDGRSVIFGVLIHLISKIPSPLLNMPAMQPPEALAYASVFIRCGCQSSRRLIRVLSLRARKRSRRQRGL